MSFLAIIYGTRPEFLKVRSVIMAARATALPHRVIRVNQHIGFNEDASFYDQLLELPVGGDRLNAIGSTILRDLPAMIAGAAAVLVQGDTATAFYAALAAFQASLKVVHLEAGMRTYDLENPFPEEGFRQMISRITDLHLCPSLREACLLNIREGVEQARLSVVGNTILDLVASYGHMPTRGQEVLITLHRRENWSTFAEYLKALCNLAAKNGDYHFTFVAHPNPTLRAALDAIVPPTNFRVVPPMAHQELVAALAACAFVITDSGGIQEEANFFGKHMYVLRRITERSAISHDRIRLICSPEEVADISCSVRIHAPGHEYGDGKAAENVIKLIKSTYNF
jgi:UDP-N-acetylglucosamine 2-epimerase (non-hydrolysing)